MALTAPQSPPLARLGRHCGANVARLLPHRLDANMSTSHYSRPYQGPTPPNKPKGTAWYLAGFGGLLLVDILALAGSRDLVESLTLVGLTVINLWALDRYSR